MHHISTFVLLEMAEQLSPSIADTLPALSRHQSQWLKNHILNTQSTSKGNRPDHLRLLVQALSCTSKDELDIVTVFRAILDLVNQSEHDREVFRSIGLIPLMVHKMAIHPSHIELQLVAFNVLKMLAENDQSVQTEISQREGIEAIFDTLTAHQDNLDVATCSVSLIKLLALEPDNRSRLFNSTRLQILLSVTKRFIEDEQLVQSASSCFAALVFGSSDIRQTLGTLGAVETLSEVLRVHITSQSAQFEVTLALRNLMWKCPSNHEAALGANTITILFDSLSCHASHPGISEQILGALGNMISSSSNIRYILLRQKALVQRLFVHLSLESCLADQTDIICSILINLSDEKMQTERVCPRIVSKYCLETDGAAFLAAALKRARDGKWLNAMIKIARIIHLLSISEEFRAAVGHAGVISTYLDARTENDTFNNPRVVFSMLESLISILSGSDANKRKFSNLNGLSITITLMQKGAKDNELTKLCTKLLDNASDGQQATAQELVKNKESVISAVITAMADFPDCPHIQEYACSLLVKIAGISQGDAAYLSRVGARNAVEMARCRHLGNPTVESLANQLLSVLVDDATRFSRENNSLRGNASLRLRSRSRTVQATNRARSRTKKSRSPCRMLKDGRRAMMAARLRNGQSCTNGDGTNTSVQSGPDQGTKDTTTVISSRCVSRRRIGLEPVYE